MMRPMVVTVYVPLCSEHCTFCDRLTIPSTLRDVVRYREALLAEIDAVGPDLADRRVEAVRFTGGVPLLLGGAGVAEVLSRLRRRLRFAEGAEVTVETVPGKIDEHNFRLFPAIGVNRLEFVLATLVQSEHDRFRCPGVHGQIHEHDAVRRHLGPDNWGIALGYGLPGQTGETWDETLRKALALKPPHVSLNRLRPAAARDGGGGGAAAAGGRRALRDHAVALLREAGYGEYVVDRFALPGFACRYVEQVHASADELGLGAGAQSLVGGFSYRNTNDVATYLACSADPERVVKDVAEVDAATRDALASLRALSQQGGLRMPPTFEATGGESASSEGGADARRREKSLAECLESLAGEGWVLLDGSGAWVLTDEGAFCKEEVFERVGACLAAR